MDEKAIATIDRQSALDAYGTGDDIKTMAKRIRLCLPGGSKLSDYEALALAQVSIAYSLNPFNGEVWHIPGRGTMVGIAGRRKAAHRQGDYWTEFILLSLAERQQLGIPDNAVAYRCLIYRPDLIRRAAEAIKLMREAGMANAFERYAYKPTEGIGYATAGESTKMKTDQAARKRAESDALKQAFDLPFGSEVGNGNRVGYVDPEWHEVESPPANAINAIISPDASDDPLGIDAPTSTGPTWTPELAPEDTDAEPPVVEPARPKAKLAEVEPAVRNDWRAAALALAEMFPDIYEDGDGKPNYFRMRGALAKHGILTVRADNLEAAVDILRSHANDKLAESATEPLPGLAL